MCSVQYSKASMCILRGLSPVKKRMSLSRIKQRCLIQSSSCTAEVQEAERTRCFGPILPEHRFPSPHRLRAASWMLPASPTQWVRQAATASGCLRKDLGLVSTEASALLTRKTKVAGGILRGRHLSHKCHSRDDKSK